MANENLICYRLLRLSIGLMQAFPIDMDADGWLRLYQTAERQSLLGICYKGVCLLPEGSKPPMEIAMLWASDAETIRGLLEISTSGWKVEKIVFWHCCLIIQKLRITMCICLRTSRV